MDGMKRMLKADIMQPVSVQSQKDVWPQANP